GYIKMLFVGQEDYDSPEESPDELPDKIGRNLGPRRDSYGSQTDGDSGVDVRGAVGVHGIDTDKHRHGPSGGNHYPARVLSFCFGEHNVGDDPVTKDNKKHRSEKFGPKDVHVDLWLTGG